MQHFCQRLNERLWPKYAFSPVAKTENCKSTDSFGCSGGGQGVKHELRLDIFWLSYLDQEKQGMMAVYGIPLLDLGCPMFFWQGPAKLICILRSDRSAGRITIMRTFINTKCHWSDVIMQIMYPDTDLVLVLGVNGSFVACLSPSLCPHFLPSLSCHISTILRLQTFQNSVSLNFSVTITSST